MISANKNIFIGCKISQIMKIYFDTLYVINHSKHYILIISKEFLIRHLLALCSLGTICQGHQNSGFRIIVRNFTFRVHKLELRPWVCCFYFTEFPSLSSLWMTFQFLWHYWFINNFIKQVSFSFCPIMN